MKTSILKKELPIWLVILPPFVYMLWNIDIMPKLVPTHWNVYGEIDAYGNPWFLPLFHIGLYVLMLVVPTFGKAAENIQKFAKPYYVMRVIMHIFFSIIISVVLFAAFGYAVQIEKIIVPLLLIVFMIIGNYMPTFRQNSFVGLRSPWTMQNELVWKETHFLAGKVWFWGSVIAFPISLYLQHVAMFIFFMSYIVVIVAIPMIYSYRLYKRVELK